MIAAAHYDVAVVGGGHNGLVCAAYLAAAGLSVAVLERGDRVGGAAITEEFHPGFRNSVASYTVSLLQRKVIEQLDLKAQGLRIVPRPLANFVPSTTGPGLKLSRDPACARAAIARHCARDAERYPAFLEALDAVTDLLRPSLLEAPVEPAAGWRERWRAFRLAARLVGAGPRPLGLLWDLFTGSAGHWLDGWFESDLLKGALGFDAVVGHFASPYDNGSGYLLLHHSLGELDGARGAWGHAIGGMGAIAAALERAARARGVRVHLEHAVERIVTAAEGFEIHAGGRMYGARAVAAGIHPQRLFLDLVESDRLPDEFLSRLRAWQSESASFRVNVALSELPDFTCLPGRTPDEHHGAGILITPSLGYLDTAYVQARLTGYSTDPVIELLIPSVIDDSLAPPGAHVASLFCQHFRRHLPEGGWGTRGGEALDRIIETVDRHAPNFRRSIIATQVLTPEDLERRFGLVGGDIFHGRMTLDQLYWARPAWGQARYRTPIEGLYLCGSGAHPGGGVTGAPGHNAAQAILNDLRRRRRGRVNPRLR